MKPVRFIGTSALFLLLGLSAPAFARQDKPDDHGGQAAGHSAAKPAPEQQANPAQQQPESRPARQQSKPAQQPQAKPASRQETAKPAQQPQAKPAQRQQQANAPASAKPAPAARQTQQPQQAKQQQPQRQSGQQGQPQRTAAQQQTQRSQPALRVSVRTTNRIPQDRFQANFGQGHNFRMGNPHMVGGYSRFSYGGFNFGFVEPWPVGWYYTDDVYIDYVDGEYFLFDPYYPGARVEISVVM
jgi:outer membrane biosynthesis protein TonB